MTTSFPGFYSNGENLGSVPVQLDVDAQQQLRMSGGDFERHIPVPDIRASDRLARVPRFLSLPDGGVIEVPSNDASEAALAALLRPRPVNQLVHALESRAAIAAAATLLLVAAVAVTLWRGLPVLAHRAALAVPTAIEMEAGQAGARVFARAFRPSQLSVDDQSRVKNQLDRLAQVAHPHVALSATFMALGMPNAFALPGGVVVVSDELVQLAKSDDELAAVLAHEIGHVELRHGLQSVLRNSSALIVVSTVTGDLSTLSTFSATLPFLLLQYGYNREFEHEADVYAVGLLRNAHIDPVCLATMLRRLEQSRPTASADFSYLSTHPATEDRIRFVKEFRLPPSADPAPRSVNATPHQAVAPQQVTQATGDLAYAFGQATVSDVKLKVAYRPSPLVTRPRADSLPRLDAPQSSAAEAPDRLPEALVQPPPSYPSDMLVANISGEVVVDFVVDPQGRVQNAHVVRATHPQFEAPALEAVKQWQFKPGEKNGHPVFTHMQVPVAFNLESQ